jgi:hypothetical protein
MFITEASPKSSHVQVMAETPAQNRGSIVMFAKITNTAIAAIVAISATIAVATTASAGPRSVPTLAEKLWMDRATGSVDH